jgi:hypothetical protein
VAGWCAKTDVEGRFNVHVDVVFTTGKFGGAPNDKIEFELNLKRAQIVVICGDGAKARISSIARESVDWVGKEIISVSTSKNVGGGVSLALDTKPSTPLSAKARLEAAAKAEVENKREFERSIGSFLVQHLMTDDHKPSWEVLPGNGKTLLGSPWDASDRPRIQIDFVGDAVSKEPSVRIEVRCRGEDLDFGEGIVIKDSAKAGLFVRKPNRDVNRAAAEQFLKEVLRTKGLSAGGVGEKFGSITIADVVLTVE